MNITFAVRYYTVIGLCLDGHGVLFNSKRHTDGQGVEVNMIKFYCSITLHVYRNTSQQ